MTYIRMTGGRDRGYVKDMPYPEAQEMLALGQALPVDFDERDALGFRELPDVQLSAASSQPSALPVISVAAAATVSTSLANTPPPTRKKNR